MRQAVFIPIYFPSQNKWINWLKSKKGIWIYNSKKKKYQEDIRLIIRNKLKPVDRVKITFVWVEPHRRRDWDNITSFSKKFILDAFVEEGIIKDDRRKYVCGIEDQIPDELIDRKNPGVHVIIEEISG